MKRRLILGSAIVLMSPILYWASLGSLYYRFVRWGTGDWDTMVRTQGWYNTYATPSRWLDYRWRWYADITEDYVKWFEEPAVLHSVE